MKSDIIEELQQVNKLLQLEKKAELDQFINMVKKLPLTERKKKGLTWYPLDLAQSGFTYGDRAFITVRRTLDKNPHQFRAGKMVRIYSMLDGESQREKLGTVQFVDRQKMKIILNSKDIPDWIRKGGLAIDLAFDERSFQEMEKAMNKVINANGDRLAELRSILLGKEMPSFRLVNHPIEFTNLNPSQNKAVQQVVASENVTIIHGPPGTGKTTTLTYAIKLLSQQEACVLVTAPSNTAVDLLTERLAAMDLTVVRVGNISRVDESIMRHTLDARLAAHPDSKTIKKVKIQAAEARRNAQKYKRNFGQRERGKRSEYWREAKELSAWANQLEERLIEQVLHSAHVITCTLVGSSNRVLDRMAFRTVVIDEAAQGLEPATWIPISRASKVVLTGDPYQLPPTVKNRDAQRKGFQTTLLEKCLERYDQVNLLNTQYRMHQTIMGFSNQRFYNNQLKADASVATERLLFDENTPIVYIDTAGCGFDEKVNPQYKSRYSPDEYNILREHLYKVMAQYGDIPLPTIAIISPYREQVVYIQDQIKEDPDLAELPITVDTIDGFQGQERELIYISLVRSNSKMEIGFLKDYRRMNVAMTRAKKKLVVIGDSATIGNDPFYSDFLEYCEQHGTYQSAWEYMQ